jgi:hypothetical protein
MPKYIPTSFISVSATMQTGLDQTCHAYSLHLIGGRRDAWQNISGRHSRNTFHGSQTSLQYTVACVTLYPL